MLQQIKNCLTVYSTSRQVRIKSTCLAMTKLVLVVTIWCAYLGSLELDLRKIYQKTCPVRGAIVSKVKGILSTEDLSNDDFLVNNSEIYKRVWDTSDLIFDGEHSFIAVTNVLITPNQTKGFCAESKKSKALCKRDEDCEKGQKSSSSTGVFSGKCINHTGTCQVSAWCPLEQNTIPLKGNKALLEGVQNFTIMLKNSVEFPDCGPNLHRRNILENITKSYLSNCIYDMENDTLCPIFRIGDIVKWSGETFSDVAVTGGVFRIEARWNCDFDWGFTENFCFPKYHFSRIDRSNAKVSPGWNFRMASYHEENRRTLRKIYGLKILVSVAGEGKRFDFLKLILTLGATVGLFALAPLVCDHLFELLAALKKFKPCSEQFGDFSIKSRFNDSVTHSEDCHQDSHQASSTKFDFGFSNNIRKESIACYNSS